MSNAPESEKLTTEELQLCVEARECLVQVRRTFENTWIGIGHTVVALRKAANRIGGKYTFRRLRDQQGLGELDPTEVSHLEAIMAVLPDIQKWREGLTPKKQRSLNCPNAIFNHYPWPTKDGDPVVTHTPRQAAGKIKAGKKQGEVLKLDPHDKAAVSADKVIKAFNRAKAKAFAQQILKLLEVTSASAMAKPSQQAASEPRNTGPTSP